MWTSKPKINPKNLPKRSQKTFYNFAMDILSRVLIAWKDTKGQEKYFFDKPGQLKYYKYKINAYWETGDYIMVIVMAIIVLYQKEKL